MKFNRTPNRYFLLKKSKKIIVFKRGKEPGKTYFMSLMPHNDDINIPRRRWTFINMEDMCVPEIKKIEAQGFIPNII